MQTMHVEQCVASFHAALLSPGHLVPVYLVSFLLEFVLRWKVVGLCGFFQPFYVRARLASLVPDFSERSSWALGLFRRWTFFFPSFFLFLLMKSQNYF